MSAFWGYAGADWLALIIIGAAAAGCLACALLFVKRYSA
ncbi:conserved hypothetical protein [Hyphomicrobium denitrificans ATCC 51888]|uniref:Uncharacterized protein n=1 Tax=Hyphomicrobium denitrificans (strain ATCC 51888 / DSM 1869 / NCIMB 11706 / TK 0415) TaxID=582899 RepID=D8JPV7_HYPDA|nr:conserved hypothetical protein [Hyphomicrobium denitrificans ATCC 51888]